MPPIDENAEDLDQTAADAVSDEDAALWAEFDKADEDAAAGNAPAEADTTEADDFGDGDDDGDGDGDEVVATGDGDDGAATDTAAADTAAAAPSLWDNAPPELRAEYEALAAKTAKIEQQARSAAGRATGFQRRYEELLKAAQPRKTNDADRAEVEAALAALKDDYPEIAQPLQKALGALEGNVKELAEAEDRRRQAATEELNSFVQTETSQVLEEHPDYLEVLGSNAEELAAWVDDQPRRVREAFARNAEQIVNATEASEIVSSFKAYLGQPAPAPADPGRTQPLSSKRERQLASTATPSSRHRRPTVSGIPEEGDPQAIWDAFEAAERK